MILKVEELKNVIPFLVYQRFHDENTLVISLDKLLFSLKCLKNHITYQYKVLSCISGVDFLEKSNYRFCVVYDLLSITFNNRLRLKVFTNQTTYVPSIVNIFINANWWEREIWDLFGIFFKGHPDLRRILTDYGFEGFPMRKDFPLYGFFELRYDDIDRKIVMEPISLTQELRYFSFSTSW